MDFLTKSDLERFWSKVDVLSEDDCWPWKARSKTSHGYGVLRVREHGNVVASRISCFLAYGSPAQGRIHALHSCDNPPCCNPKHLRWGTPKDNSKDAIDRDRASKPPVNIKGRNCGKMPKGEESYNAVLTEDKVRRAWEIHLAGGVSATDIAIAVGATKDSVYDACRGKTWRHVEGAPSLTELKAGGVRRGFNQFRS